MPFDMISRYSHYQLPIKALILEQLRFDLTRALTDEEVERRGLSRKLLPYVQKFYDDYFDRDALQPFYRQSSIK